MSFDDAKNFVEKLQSDGDLRDRFEELIKSQGFSCSLDDIHKVEFDIMMHCQSGKMDCPFLCPPSYKYCPLNTHSDKHLEESSFLKKKPFWHHFLSDKT